MKGIDPKWSFWLGVLIFLEQGIGQGTVKLTNVIPADWIPYVVAWCALLAWIGGALQTAMIGYSSKEAGPLTATVSPAVKALILIAVLLGSLFMLAGDARAQNKPPLQLKPLTGNIVNDFGLGTGSGVRAGLTGSPLNDIIGALDVKLLPDLQYALKLATASGSKVTGPCYQAWIDLINVRQKAVQDDQAPPQALPLPDPHLVTDFEKLVELRNSLQPDSDFMIRCSPVASMVKKDIIGFIGVVISGGAGLATLVPGL